MDKYLYTLSFIWESEYSTDDDLDLDDYVEATLDDYKISIAKDAFKSLKKELKRKLPSINIEDDYFDEFETDSYIIFSSTKVISKEDLQKIFGEDLIYSYEDSVEIGFDYNSSYYSEPEPTKYSNGYINITFYDMDLQEEK